MSLDNPNEWKVNLTEERRQRDKGEKLEENDRDLIQLKKLYQNISQKLILFYKNK